MIKLILIWLFQKLTYVAEALQPAFVGLSISLFLVAAGLTIFAYVESNDLDAKIRDAVRTNAKRLYRVAVVVLCLAFGSIVTKSVRLSDTEYKTAVVYCLGSEIMNSSIGEKSLDIIDAKLNNWLDLINQSNPGNTKKDDAK